MTVRTKRVNIEERRYCNIGERYEVLKLAIEKAARHNQLKVLDILLDADTPSKLHNAIAQHPALLDDETLKALEAIATEAEQKGEGGIAFAQGLRLRLNE